MKSISWISTIIICSITLTAHTTPKPCNQKKREIYEKAMQQFAQNITNRNSFAIKIDSKKSDGCASYNRVENTIFIAPTELNNIEQLEGILLHELGHAQAPFTISLQGICILGISLSIYISTGLLATKNRNPQILLPAFAISFLSMIVMPWLVALNEERIADQFSAQHCSSAQVAHAMYSDQEKIAESAALFTKKTKEKLFNTKTPLRKKITAILDLCKDFIEIHPAAKSRAEFFKKAAEQIQGTRGKSLRKYIQEIEKQGN